MTGTPLVSVLPPPPDAVPVKFCPVTLAPLTLTLRVPRVHSLPSKEPA